MVLAQEPRRPPGSRARPQRAPTRPRPLGAAEGGPGADEATRAAALRRIVAEVSGSQDLDRLFQEVIDASFALFGADRAGLWIYDDSPAPLNLAAQRGLSSAMLELIASLPRDAQTVGMTALRERHVTILAGDLEGTVPRLQRMYRAEGIRSMCFVPIVFRDEVLGLLVLYHRTDYEWSDDETDLARSFGDHIAIAMQNTRLAEASHALAERLGRDLRARRPAQPHPRHRRHRGLDRRRGRPAHRPRHHPRLPRRPRCRRSASRSPSRARSSAAATPTQRRSGSPSARASPGWVAANNQTVRSGDAGADPRGVVMGSNEEPESMLIVPMAFEDVVHGVVVISKRGRDRFDADDETTFGIFASYAAQALVNASNVGRLQLQQAELHHQLVSQRRLLEVNERLLSTLEPNSVLDLIANSLKVIVPYDTLTIYRVDRVAGVRRAVIARDRFADLILAHESPLGVGISGWVVDHGEAVLANEAHNDPRSVQVPGTPFEPESMIVVPLLVGGEAIGTLNIGRMGEAEAFFSANEFDLTKLFAGQASIALQNAETHGEVRVRAEHDALTGIRNHGAFQADLGEAVRAGGSGGPFAVLMMDLDAFKAFNDTRGHPAGDALLTGIARAMSAAVRDGDRIYRYGGDEFAAILPGADRVAAHDVAERLRRTVAELSSGTPRVSISVGVSCYPDDGRSKDALVAVADRAMYLAKPTAPVADGAALSDDPYLRALDETALALLDRRDGAMLLETILTRACSLLGTPHGYIFIAEPDGLELDLRHGSGLFAQGVGHRQPVDKGIGGQVFLTGQPVTVDDYDAWARRAGIVPNGMLSAVVGVPLFSGDEVVGVIGLASSAADRTFGQRDVAALTRFAQLASIAIDNARLVDVAKRGALYDPTTGLPNRELLTDRIAHALSRVRPDEAADRGDHARPRPLQGHQRERRSRRRRPDAHRGRTAARREPAARRHGRPVRRRRVRDHPRPRLR